jgi:hypothetical protein
LFDFGREAEKQLFKHITILHGLETERVMAIRVFEQLFSIKKLQIENLTAAIIKP